MTAIYHVVASDDFPPGEADSIDGIVELVKAAGPGCYRIERLSLEAATGDLRSWDWGAITKSREGMITLDLSSWID